MQVKLLQQIVQAGIMGIEVYSTYHSQKQIEFYEKQAEKYGLIRSLGSDFHGKTKPSIKLGDVPGKFSEEEIYNTLMLKLPKYK